MRELRHPIEDPAVEREFLRFSEEQRAGLLKLRELIYDTARDTDGVGELLETLKWNQPSYLTPETKSGTTIRLGVPKEGGFAIYVHCQTTVIADFESEFPDEFDVEGSRAVRFTDAEDLPLDKLRALVKRALTYHLRAGEK